MRHSPSPNIFYAIATILEIICSIIALSTFLWDYEWIGHEDRLLSNFELSYSIYNTFLVKNDVIYWYNASVSIGHENENEYC